MKNHTLRTRLFLWYLASLIILAIFFYAVVHIWQWPHGSELFFLLLFLLAVSGFFLIWRITRSLTSLTSQIENISSRNLDQHIKGIKGRNEIGELARSFNDLLDRLNEAFKREQQFIADVAHELKTPLAIQRSALEVTLAQQRPEQDYKNALKDALAENNRLDATLKNVLDLAWSEVPHERKHATKFNLSELLEEVNDIAAKMSLSKKITITPAIQKQVYVVGFKDKLARAIINVVDNAIKYTPPGGQITIKLEQQRRHANISIRDTGRGIGRVDLPHIFQRFYRGSSGAKALGSGLGLAIVKAIIDLHRGTVRVTSREGKGSVFLISLPVRFSGNRS